MHIRFSRRRLDPASQEGLALAAVLAILAFFAMVTVTAATMASSTQETAATSDAQQGALAIAEAGVNEVEAMLNYQSANGGNPTAANLLGCAGADGAADTTGPSNCSSAAPLTFCVSAPPGCSAGAAGTASVYGYFSGTNPGSYLGASLAASTWMVVSTGYVADPNASGILARTVEATITISPLGQGGIAAVWNHIFVTAPLVANTCQLDFSSANNVNVNVPIYTVGNVCLGTNTIIETTQPIDLMVGGKLYLSAGTVGASALAPITAGVVVGGCTTVSISSQASPCDNGTFHYWVKSKDTFVPQDAPTLSPAQTAADYASFDPGPVHTCQPGTTPAPLADGAFDNDVGASEPDDSGSGSSGTAFELVPNSSYACISKNGPSSGYLIWNNASSGSITVDGVTVPPKTLAVNGNLFFDSNLTISQSFTYSGVAMIEAAGTITISGNSTTVCAVAGCSSLLCPTNWQGSSGNTSMLTLAALAANTTAISFGNGGGSNNEVFQGSLWTQPSSKITFVKNGDLVAGPISVGSFDATFNNATLCPLPVLKNMPTGAPLPPNTSVAIGAPVYVRY